MFSVINLNLRSCLVGFLFLIFIYNLITYLWNRRYWYYYSRKLNGPFNWPLIGYGWKFLGNNEDMFNVIDNFCKTYKTPAAVWFGPNLYFVITDPKHYQIILNKTLHKSHIVDFISDNIGTGILTAPVDKWKRNRKLIQPTFNPKILNSFVEIFSKQSKNFVEDLSGYVGKGFFDVFPLFNQFNLTIVCNTLMGNDILRKKQILDCQGWVNSLVELTYQRIFKVWYHPKVLWNLTSSSKRAQESATNLNNFIKEIIIHKREQYKLKLKQNETDEYNSGEDNSKWKGFLDYVIEISEESGQLTNDEIVEEATVMLAAGTDSTAATTSYVMLMLGLYQNIQDKVFDEIHSIFGDSDRPAEEKDLNEMIYLERVIKETMRLCPVSPVLIRVLNEDIQLESHTLPSGSSCVLSIFETHRDPKIWENPLEFDPDRFLSEQVAKRHSYAFIPFSAGPRNCIGSKFAMMAMKVVVSTVLRSYKVSTSYKKFSDIKFSQIIILRCVDGFNIGLEYRN